jgi:hypothetical protein
MLLQRGSGFWERRIRDDGKTVKYGIQLQQDTMYSCNGTSIRDGYGTIPLHNVLYTSLSKQPVIIVLRWDDCSLLPSLTAFGYLTKFCSPIINSVTFHLHNTESMLQWAQYK